MTVTGSASQMRGSGYRDKQLSPGYRPIGLRRNSACLRIYNGQKQGKLSEYGIGNRANGGSMKKLRILARICLI